MKVEKTENLALPKSRKAATLPACRLKGEATFHNKMKAILFIILLSITIAARADETADIARAQTVIANPEQYGAEEYRKAKVFLRERGLVPAIRARYRDRTLETLASAFEAQTFRKDGRYPTGAEIDASLLIEVEARRRAGQLDNIQQQLEEVKRRLDEHRRNNPK